MNKIERAEIEAEEIRIAQRYFDNQCLICHKKVVRVVRKKIVMSFKGFTYHHRRYRAGEPRRKDFPKGPEGTWQYKKAVLPFVEKHHQEFFLLTNNCHGLLERRLYPIWKHNPEKFERLIHACKNTHT